MKTKLLPILRYIVLALLLLCIVLCRFFPVMAEGYACHIYPWLSAALSAIASVFPFSLEEVLVVVIILWMIIYPFLKRRKKKSWRFIVGREVELLAWVYIWFYLGWKNGRSWLCCSWAGWFPSPCSVIQGLLSSTPSARRW